MSHSRKQINALENGAAQIPPYPCVSVVVATYNQQKLLAQCLTSILDQDYRPMEVIVVENGSSEDVRAVLRGLVPNARVIRNRENLGFAGGYNTGMRVATGEYVAILNDDAVACSDWLTRMVAVAENDKAIGVVGSIILDGNRPGFLDSCGVGVAFDGMSRQAMRGRIPPVLSRPKEVLLASGCACLFRVQALQEVGLFDEDFFAYCEDTDLGLRLRRAGWKAAIAPGAVVNHYYSMTTGRLSLRKLYWVERNHLWVAMKNFPLLILPLVPLVTLWRHLVQLLVAQLGPEEFRTFRVKAGPLRIAYTVARANIDAVAGIPAMLRKRKAASASHRVTSREMCKLLFAFRLPVSEILGVDRAGE